MLDPKESRHQSGEKEMIKYGDFGCALCQSHNSQKSGSEIIQGRTYLRIVCQDCGHTWKQAKV